MSQMITFTRRSALAQYLENLDPATADLIGLMDTVVSNQTGLAVAILALQNDGIAQHAHNTAAVDFTAKALLTDIQQLETQIKTEIGVQNES